jgi:tetratricopeptide (TPR) repeat protein
MASPGQQPQSAAASPALARIAAQSQIEFELEFFSAVLDQRPEFVEVLKAHAKNLALARRHQEGLEIDSRITRLRPTDSLARYNLACSLSLTGRYDEALAELRKAVELGYRDFPFMMKDRDLDPIRRDPRFRDLVREFDRKR